jgi:hypothetical protein
MTLEAAGKQCQIVGPLNPSALIGRFHRELSFFTQSSSLFCPLSSMNVHGTNFAPSTSFHTVPETGFYPSGSNTVLQYVSLYGDGLYPFSGLSACLKKFHNHRLIHDNTVKLLDSTTLTASWRYKYYEVTPNASLPK